MAARESRYLYSAPMAATGRAKPPRMVAMSFRKGIADLGLGRDGHDDRVPRLDVPHLHEARDCRAVGFEDVRLIRIRLSRRAARLGEVVLHVLLVLVQDRGAVADGPQHQDRGRLRRDVEGVPLLQADVHPLPGG
jgi:hypothetical protein